MVVGSAAVFGNWGTSVNEGITLQSKVDQRKSYNVLEGGDHTGKKQCTVIAQNDPAATLQPIDTDHLAITQSSTLLPSSTQFLDSLAGAVTSVHKQYTVITNSSVNSDSDCEVLVFLGLLMRITEKVHWCLPELSAKNPQRIKSLIGLIRTLSDSSPTEHLRPYYEQQFLNSWS